MISQLFIQSECVLDFILLQFNTLIKSRGFLCFATYEGRFLVTPVLDHSFQRHQCIMRRRTTPAVPSHDSSDHLLCTTLARLCQWFLRGRVRPTPSSCVSELGHHSCDSAARLSRYLCHRYRYRQTLV